MDLEKDEGGKITGFSFLGELFPLNGAESTMLLLADESIIKLATIFNKWISDESEI